MKSSTPRIKSVKFKSGGHIEVLPDSTSNYSRVVLRCGNKPWGEVTFRCYDDSPITVADLCYMADCAKNEIMGDDS